MSQPTGFRNTGNVCYFNSLLQALVSCQHFTNVVSTPGEQQSYTIEEIRNLVRDLTNGKSVEKYGTNILSALMNDLKRRSPEVLKSGFGGGHQSCVDEGFTHVLDMINNPIIDGLFDHVYEERIVCNKCDKVIEAKRGKSNKFELFDEASLIRDGIAKNILQNECNIPDYLPDKIHDCQDESYRRVYRLKYIPKVVVVVLNRYRTTGRELIPRNPDVKLPDIFAMPGVEGKDIHFKKMAEVDHFGSLVGGHYVARCVRGFNVYKFDDLNMQSSTLGTNVDTYLTFYERSE
jgi:uncharacterized UBP type Zn finger protein